MNCQCSTWNELVNISDWHEQFREDKVQLEQSDGHLLCECSSCSQLWLIDRHEMRNVSYAYKIDDQAQWQQFDTRSLVKAKMLQNREGVSDAPCKLEACGDNAVNGSRYCVDHLYDSGSRI